MQKLKPLLGRAVAAALVAARRTAPYIPLISRPLLLVAAFVSWGVIGFLAGRSMPPEIRTVEVPTISLEAPSFIAVARPEPKPAETVRVTLSEDLLCMAANIFHEARGEETERGKGMVGQAFMNRVGKPQYRDSVCGVIHQYKQASWTLARPYVDLSRKGERVSMIEAFRIAQDVLDGKYEAQTNGAFMYYNPHKVTPYWADDYVEVATVGQHRFLK